MSTRMMKLAWSSLAMLATLGAWAAKAASVTFDISWTDYYSASHTAEFTAFLSPIASSPGEYNVTSVSGTYAGQPITGVTTVYEFPDNIFYAPVTGSTAVDYEGIDFSFGSNDANFFYNGGYAIMDNSSTFYQADVGSPSIVFSAAPEPAGWALMLFGVGSVGGALRLARKRATAPFAA